MGWCAEGKRGDNGEVGVYRAEYPSDECMVVVNHKSPHCETTTIGAVPLASGWWMDGRWGICSGSGFDERVQQRHSQWLGG